MKYRKPHLKEKKKGLRLNDAKKEALEQALDACDWQMYNDIMDGIYKGPWPEHIVGNFYTSLYPDILHLRIAGLNHREGINDLTGFYFDAILVLEPDNEHDPNAIKIICAEDGRHIGYIPAEATKQVREWANNNFPYPCFANIKKGQEWDKTIYLFGFVNIYRPGISPNVSLYKN